ncbi:MAG TPA: NAD(P)H-binding protein [Planctomycetota bacterium]|nr:NAD(P)H-binding protein [Planctomycetota bacterium]
MSVSDSPHSSQTPAISGALKVLVSGSTGYVGRHVVRRLAKQGFSVRALVRGGSDRSVIAPYTNDFFEGSVTDRDSLNGACNGCFAVVHLVGIINEAEDTFEHIHVDGTRNLIDEAKLGGVKRFVYLSGLGSRPDARARYHKTKYAAEQLVSGSGMEGYNFPASVIFGPEDEFLNLFVTFAKNIADPRYPPWPIMPAIGGGTTMLQPIWVEDVAEVLANACAPDFPKKLPPGTYELAGPEALSVKQIMKLACRAAERHRIFVPVPYVVANILAGFMEKFSSKPMLCRDQVLMLQEDGRAKNNKAPEILGHPPRRMWDYVREHFLKQ